MPNTIQKNVKLIKDGTNRAAPRMFQIELRNSVMSKTLSLRNKMIAEFLSHPITREIQMGPFASNISGTLNGYGNLFSFIGFDYGTDPIGPILEIIQSTRFNYQGITPRGIQGIIQMPTASEIFEATPMPWAEGRSWAHGIESGISGLGQFFQERGEGRSGGGFQSTEKLTSGVRFRNVQYISALLNKYSQEFRLIV